MNNLKYISLRLVAAIIFPCYFFSCTKDTTPKEDPNYSTGLAAVISNNFSLTNFEVALQTTQNFTQLTEAGPFTVFAPANNSFIPLEVYSPIDIRGKAALLGPIMPYHIYKGKLNLVEMPFEFNKEEVMLNDIKVYVSHAKNVRDTSLTVNGIRIDNRMFEASNGFIYAIDKLLMPTSSQTIKELLANDVKLTFFNAALQRSGVQDELANTKVYTVFAAENAAFNEIGIPTTDSINNMDPELLRNMIKSHITEGRNFINDYIMQADVATNIFLEKMQDGKDISMLLIPEQRPNRFSGLDIERPDNTGNLVRANITGQDITASNGVVHKINKVFLP